MCILSFELDVGRVGSFLAGLAVGRGAAISVILVLTVLPQMIVLFDKAISKTTIKSKKRGGE